jgi:hypothetical protein
MLLVLFEDFASVAPLDRQWRIFCVDAAQLDLEGRLGEDIAGKASRSGDCGVDGASLQIQQTE